MAKLTMDKVTNKMLEKINQKIDYTVKEFYRNNKEWSNSHERRMAEIDGMIDMLSIATGKDYIMTENGLTERKIEKCKRKAPNTGKS